MSASSNKVRNQRYTRRIMSRALKRLLLWLLIAALPLQGLAAAMQTSCAGVQEGSAHEMMHWHHAATQTSADIEDHGHAHATHDHAPHHADDEADASQHQASSCSACASCCVGMTMPLTAGTLPATPTSSELVILAPDVPPAGFTPAGLERPPKSISA